MIKAVLAAFLLFCVSAYGQDQGLPWTTLDQLSKSDRSWVKLDEDEYSLDVQVALARLSESTAPDQFDSILVHHQSSLFCGSAGCLLEVLHRAPGNSGYETILQLNVDQVDLGRNFDNGMRNLRFGGGAVTWRWTGEEYEIK